MEHYLTLDREGFFIIQFLNHSHHFLCQSALTPRQYWTGVVFPSNYHSPFFTHSIHTLLNINEIHYENMKNKKNI